MKCIKPSCGGTIVRTPVNHRNGRLCDKCSTSYTAKGLINMTGTDWTPAAKNCTPGYAKFRKL